MVKKIHWGRALVVAAVGSALTVAWADATTPKDKNDAMTAQAASNPRPPLGGSRDFGASKEDPVPLGSLQPSYHAVDLTVKESFGSFTFSRMYSSADTTWKTNRSTQSYPFANPFGLNIDSVGQIYIKWWHSLYSYVSINQPVCTQSEIENGGGTRCYVPFWNVRDSTGKAWDFEPPNSFDYRQNNGCPVSGRCFGILHTPEDVKLERTPEGFILYTAGGRYHYNTAFTNTGLTSPLWTPNMEAIYFLSYIEDEQYPGCTDASCVRRRVTLNYGSPNGCSSSPAPSLDAFVNLATLADGQMLRFNYQTVPSGGQCFLASVALLSAGSSPNDPGVPVVQYTYDASSGSPKPGLLASAYHPETNQTTTYSYDVNGQRAWVVREGQGSASQVNSGGRLVTQKLLDNSLGYVTQDATPHRAYTVTAENNHLGSGQDVCQPGTMYPSYPPIASCSSSQWQYFDTGDVTSGHGSGTSTHVRNEFLMTLPYDSTALGPVMVHSIKKCDPSYGSCEGLPTAVDQTWGVSSDLAPTYYKSANGNFTVYQNATPDSAIVPSNMGFTPLIETRGVKSGATATDGTNALQTQNYTYEYGRAWEQRVKTEQHRSVLVAESEPGSSTTTYQYEDTGRLKAVIHGGWTRVFDPASNTWGLAYRYVGSFYATAHSCGALAGQQDPLGRTLEAQGPCWVDGPNATACAVGSSVPRNQFEFYPTTLQNNNAGRLKLKRVFSTSSCDAASALTTTFWLYDARGNVLSVQDPNGNYATYQYQGSQLVSMVAGGLTTLYGYDDGTHGDYIRHPTGDYEVVCYRANTPGPACSGGTQTDKIQWKATSSVPDGSTWTEKLVYSYLNGALSTETLLDSAGSVRRTRRFENDPLDRPTFETRGQAPSFLGFAMTSLFDAEDNRIAMGVPYNMENLTKIPPRLCGNSFGGASLCKWMQYDRLNRLTRLDEWSTTPGNLSSSCLRYDSQSHLAGVKRGCAGGSDCGSCTQPETVFTHDDFGNLILVNAPWAQDSGGASGSFSYEYDAAGGVLRKQTPTMAQATTPSWIEFSYDQLGRALKMEAVSSSSRQTLYSYVYDALAVPPSGCPAPGSSYTRGRMQVRSDSFGDVWYQYDELGRVQVAWRRRASPGAAARTLACGADNTYDTPNSSYTYDAYGRLTDETYPHGRVVHYAYYPAGSGRADRIASIDVDFWDAGASTPTRRTIISNVQWEPFGGLRAYQLHAPLAPSGSEIASVEYLQGGVNSPMSSCDTSRLSLTAGTDDSGRLHALWISTGPLSGSLSGDLFKRVYTWKADQLVQENTCLLDTSSSTPTTLFYSSSGNSSGYDGRGALQHISRPSKQFSTLGGVVGQRDYTYDSRGNLTAERQDCWRFDQTVGRTDQVTDRYMSNRICTLDGNSCTYGTDLHQQYAYDNDGRMSSKVLKDTSRNLTVDSLTFDASSLEPTASPDPGAVHAALGGVYRSVTDGLNRTYEYFYDHQGRRRLKRYNTGVEDEFFYNGGQLQVDRGNASLLPGGDYVLDDYIWLGGHPVAFIRSRFANNWQRQPDLTGSCNRNGEDSACGIYFLVGDELGKPLLALDSYRRIAFAADYEPHGKVNSVTYVKETAHSYGPNTNTVLGYFLQSSGTGLRVQLRARYTLVDTSSGDYTYLSDDSDNELTTFSGASTRASGSSQPNVITGWVDIPANGRVHSRFRSNSDALTGFGASLAGYEYRRFQQGAAPVWTPLRYPGQYYDPETGLFENFNRFYDPETGRYTAADPLAYEPDEVLSQLKGGESVPTYAYASNNPIQRIDPDGRQDGAGAERRAAGSMEIAQKCINGDEFSCKIVHYSMGLTAGAAVWTGIEAGISVWAAISPLAPIAAGPIEKGLEEKPEEVTELFEVVQAKTTDILGKGQGTVSITYEISKKTDVLTSKQTYEVSIWQLHSYGNSGTGSYVTNDRAMFAFARFLKLQEAAARSSGASFFTIVPRLVGNKELAERLNNMVAEGSAVRTQLGYVITKSLE